MTDAGPHDPDHRDAEGRAGLAAHLGRLAGAAAGAADLARRRAGAATPTAARPSRSCSTTPPASRPARPRCAFATSPSASSRACASRRTCARSSPPRASTRTWRATSTPAPQFWVVRPSVSAQGVVGHRDDRLGRLHRGLLERRGRARRSSAFDALPRAPLTPPTSRAGGSGCARRRGLAGGRRAGAVQAHPGRPDRERRADRRRRRDGRRLRAATPTTPS